MRQAIIHGCEKWICSNEKTVRMVFSRENTLLCLLFSLFCYALLVHVENTVFKVYRECIEKCVWVQRVNNFKKIHHVGLCCRLFETVVGDFRSNIRLFQPCGCRSDQEIAKMFSFSLILSLLCFLTTIFVFFFSRRGLKGIFYPNVK